MRKAGLSIVRAMAEDEEELEEEEEEEEEEVQAAKMVEDAEDDEEGATDSDIDFDAIAEKAVKAVEPLIIQARLREEPMSLEVGMSKDHLYLTGTSKVKAFDTGAASGQFNLSADDYTQGHEASMPSVPKMPREVRGAPIRPVDDAKLRRKEARAAAKERLEKWYGLPRQKLTPELEKELQVIKMRASIDPKRFYKANDSQKLPEYFAMATEVGGGMAPAGLQATTRDVNPRSGRSLLDEVMRDQRAQEWSSKKYAEAEEARQASRNSGHGKARAPTEAAASTRRGGVWKNRGKAKKKGPK